MTTDLHVRHGVQPATASTRPRNAIATGCTGISFGTSTDADKCQDTANCRAGSIATGGAVLLTSPSTATDGRDEPSGGRRCWVTGPAEHHGPFPGLVLEWRRDESDWLALVVYVIAADGHTTTVHAWVTQDQLRSA